MPVLSAALLTACLALLPGCLVLADTRLGDALPTPAAIAQVQPGRTTRAQVLALLGPPDEYRQPALPALLSVADSQAQRVRQEREIFGRSTCTWMRENREDRLWLLWPLYADLRSDIRVDRLVVLFDEHDVVSAVGCERGDAAP